MTTNTETLQVVQHKMSNRMENNSLDFESELKLEDEDRDSIAICEPPAQSMSRESPWDCNSGWFVCGNPHYSLKEVENGDMDEGCFDSRCHHFSDIDNSELKEGHVLSATDKLKNKKPPIDNLVDESTTDSDAKQDVVSVSPHVKKHDASRAGSSDTSRNRELLPPLPPRARGLGKTSNSVSSSRSNNSNNRSSDTEESSTLGSHIFSDLSSPFPAQDSATPKKADDTDDDVSISSTGGIHFPNQKVDTTASLETLTDEKLNQVGEKETIGEVPLSSEALIRQSSSLSRNRSFRRRKKVEKRSCDDSSMASSTCSFLSKTSAAMESDINRTTFLVRKLKSTIKSHGRYDEKCAVVTTSLGKHYEEENEFGQACKIYSEAVCIYSTKLGDFHAKTLEAKIRLARVLDKLGRFEEALSLYCHILSMRRAVLGENDTGVADVMSYIAHALKSQGRLIQAIKELKRALKIYRAVLGDGHPQVTYTVDEISSLYVAAGDYEKATAILEEVVKLKASISGINTMDVATSLLQLADAYKASGDHLRSLRTLKKCYSVFTAVFGEDSDEATSILERIASTYKLLGDNDKAVTAYLALLRTRKDKFGESDPSIAQTYLHLGIALRLNQQPDKARKCMKQALSIYVGKDSEMNDIGMIADIMHEMALNSITTGDLAGGVKILKQELGIRKKIGKSENSNIARTLYHLGTTEIQLRNFNKASNFFMDALAIYEKTDDEVGISFARTLYCTGIVFEATRDPTSAEEAFIESVKILKGAGLSEDEVDEIVSELDSLRNTDSSDNTQRKMFVGSKKK